MRKPSILRSSLGLAGWAAITFAAAAIGALGSASASAFYAELTRPAWAPPGWLFAPAWTTLYVLMALSAWLVWRSKGFAGARIALGLFLVQLAANALWSWLFFAWRLGTLAFVETLLLWCLIVATAIAFWRVSRAAAILLMPYLAWVTYASALTFAVWRGNPALLS